MVCDSRWNWWAVAIGHLSCVPIVRSWTVWQGRGRCVAADDDDDDDDDDVGDVDDAVLLSGLYDDDDTSWPLLDRLISLLPPPAPPPLLLLLLLLLTCPLRSALFLRLPSPTADSPWYPTGKPQSQWPPCGLANTCKHCSNPDGFGYNTYSNNGKLFSRAKALLLILLDSLRSVPSGNRKILGVHPEPIK